MRVAIFGGSFNPPHVGHQLVALYVLETAAADELWFVPCWRHTFGKALEAFEDRLRMSELAAAALGARARVSDVEARVGGEMSRTLLTIKGLQASSSQGFAHPGSPDRRERVSARHQVNGWIGFHS